MKAPAYFEIYKGGGGGGSVFTFQSCACTFNQGKMLRALEVAELVSCGALQNLVLLYTAASEKMLAGT